MNKPAPAQPAILFVNYTPYGGGDTVSVYRSAAYLSGRGYRVGIAGPPNRWLRENAASLTIELLWFRNPKLDRCSNPILGPLGYLVALLRASLHVARIAREGQWDIVHVSTLPNLAGAVGACLARRPLVWHVHEIAFQSRTAFAVLRFMPGVLARVVVCPSKALVDIYGPRKCELVPNTIPDGWPEGGGNPDVRRELGIDSSCRLVMWIGGVEPRKGLGKLLEAAGKGLGNEAKTVLLAVCRVTEKYRELYASLRERAEHLPLRTIFVENVSDPRPYYRAADLVVQTSLLPEAFGLTVLEAMAMGKPVVCAGGGGTVDFAEHRHTAHIVDPADPMQIREGINAIMGDSSYASHLTEGGLRRAGGYLASRVLPRLEKVYAGLIDR